jgi:hypothetical protein
VDPAAAYEKACEALAPFPRLEAAFVTIGSPLVAHDGLSVLLSGSIAAGNVDAMSDIDLEIVVHDAAHVAVERARIDARIRSLGNVVAHFPATHLGLPDLLIYFVEADGTLIKVDAWTSDVRIVAELPDATIIHDPGGVVAAERARLGAAGGRPRLDYDDLHQKFVGWMWFTTVKIRRGHLFEAIESIDFMEELRTPALHPPHRRQSAARVPAPRGSSLSGARRCAPRDLRESPRSRRGDARPRVTRRALSVAAAGDREASSTPVEGRRTGADDGDRSADVGVSVQPGS